MENKKAIVKLLEIGCSIEEIKGVTGLSDEGLQKYSEILDKNRLSEEDFIEKRIKRLWRADCFDSKTINKLRSSIKSHIGGMFVREMGQLNDLIGYPIELLYLDFLGKFKDGMSWDNWGEWQIDHIKPKSLFTTSELKECFRLENLQPLWRSENAKKGNKWQPKADQK